MSIKPKTTACKVNAIDLGKVENGSSRTITIRIFLEFAAIAPRFVISDGIQGVRTVSCEPVLGMPG